MDKKVIKSWKKVYKNDLNYVINELKGLLPPPSVLILTGEMGAGKTTFVQNFVGGNLKLNFSSPTYSILNESKSILHGDFYRLEKPSDLSQLELDLYLEEKEFFLVEWGIKYVKHLKAIIPVEFNYFELEIEIDSEKSGPVSVINIDEEKESSFRNYTLNKII